MSSSNVIIKSFENEYFDYSPDRAPFIKNFDEIDSNHVIKTCLPEKWSNIERTFDQLDYRDYSVYTGTSGIALLMLKKDGFAPENLNVFASDIKNLLSLSKLKMRRHTFLCGDAGPLAIGAVIAFQMGDKEEYKDLIARLVSMQNDVLNINSDLPDEILYGRAGYLYALMYVNKHTHPHPPFSEPLLRKIVEVILLSGQSLSKLRKFRCPLMYQWHESYYLGAAHGLSGILYMLLQAKQYITDTELQALIKPTIDYLTTLRFHSGNFPSSLGSENDKLVQWCHGAPGFVYLFSKAYEVFGDARYLTLALESGDVVWERGLLRKGYSLCHGVSGNAYCFLELFQRTKDVKHLYRAIKFAEWCVGYTRQHEEHFPDRPYSLFEGSAGPMYLLLDLQKPLEAKFPGFTL